MSGQGVLGRDNDGEHMGGVDREDVFAGGLGRFPGGGEVGDGGARVATGVEDAAALQIDSDEHSGRVGVKSRSGGVEGRQGVGESALESLGAGDLGEEFGPDGWGEV